MGIPAKFMSGIVSLGLISCGPEVDRQSADPRPNFVLILADDLGWGDVGFTNGRISTPNIDGLAASGVVLEQFYVLPQCTPTRAALLTGRYPFRYGFPKGTIWPWSTDGLPIEETTLAEVLADAGYETALVGKWHLGHAREELLPQNRGFEHVYGCYSDGVDYFTHKRGDSLDWHRDGKAVIEEGYATDLLASEAVRLIEERDRARPLFLYVPFTAPHAPIQAPFETQNPLDTYIAMVESLDRAVGQIIEALEDADMSDETLLWFASDNGHAIKHSGSSGRLRGNKFQAYEGGIRSTAFITWPGRIPANTTCSELLHVVDMLPTLAVLANAPIHGDRARPLDGRDIWATTVGEKIVGHWELPLLLSNKWNAIRGGDWKLVQSDRENNHPIELYNIVRDPEESENFADSEPEVLKRLISRLEYWETQVVPPTESRFAKQPEWWDYPTVLGPP